MKLVGFSGYLFGDESAIVRYLPAATDETGFRYVVQSGKRIPANSDWDAEYLHFFEAPSDEVVDDNSVLTFAGSQMIENLSAIKELDGIFSQYLKEFKSWKEYKGFRYLLNTESEWRRINYELSAAAQKVLVGAVAAKDSIATEEILKFYRTIYAENRILQLETELEAFKLLGDVRSAEITKHIIKLEKKPRNRKKELTR